MLGEHGFNESTKGAFKLVNLNQRKNVQIFFIQNFAALMIIDKITFMNSS